MDPHPTLNQMSRDFALGLAVGAIPFAGAAPGMSDTFSFYVGSFIGAMMGLGVDSAEGGAAVATAPVLGPVSVAAAATVSVMAVGHAANAGMAIVNMAVKDWRIGGRRQGI